MSFALQVRPLFRVTVRQDGSDALLPGFSFRPSAATVRRLADHALLFQGREAGLEIFYCTNPLASSPLLGRIRNRVRFTFEVHQADPSFYKTYLPDLTPATGPQIYLDNLNGAGVLPPVPLTELTAGAFVQAADMVKVRPPVFTAAIAIDGGPAPTELLVKDKFDPTRIVLHAPITVSPGAKLGMTKIDLSAQPAGPYLLHTNVAGTASHALYVDEALTAARVFGVLDLYWASAQDAVAPGGISYVVRFKKR
ncbi:MAG: hypothetical protein GX616_24770 [Planctomycetes bacterium]|nr:hypothetical protein [Planctomycetota bacterium]